MGLSIACGVAFWDHAPDGAAGVPLLLVHGAGGTHRTWPDSLREMPGRRVLSVDLPGHGVAPPPGETTIAGYASCLLGMLDALAIPRVVLAGHSMGGAIALTLALEAPARVAGLLLVGTGARLRIAPALLEASADPARKVEVSGMMAASCFGPAASEEARQVVARDVAGMAPGVLHGDFTACDGFDAMERLGPVRAPTFVVVGEEDRLTPPKFAAFLRDRLPGKGMLVVPGAGHMVATEAPAAVTAAVAGFLEGA
jgi:pimeloyl-ACP methyl ester carboxylesterase